MKDKILFTMALMCIGVLASCSGDDDDNSANIVGIWRCTYPDFERKYTSGGTKAGDILTFNSDNTYTIRGNNYENGRYSVPD